MDENNKRIAKNTIYLYIRTFVMMILSFLTTRIVLDKLGASDYGLNNIVSGFISMFTVMNSILAGSTRRFLSLNLGKGDPVLLKKTFSTAFVMHLMIAIIIVLILEICGPWFIGNKLNVEPGRIWAAQWVFQMAVVGVFLNVTQTPYIAILTSHERFNMYAIMSIYDVTAKLLVLFLLVYIPYDKLIVYALLNLIVSATSIFIYRLYCIKNFAECKRPYNLEKQLCKEMSFFSAWTILGHLTVVLNAQGSRLLLNHFFNTVMNAAEGLANTVSFTIGQFISGFTVASEPQLVKFYGAGDTQKFQRLIFNSAQYTIFITAFIAVPVFMELDYVLDLWLTEVPPYTSEFVKIGLICSLIHTTNGMIDKGLVAGGYVKQLNTVSIPLYLLGLPLVYLTLKFGLRPSLISFAIAIPTLFVFAINLYLIHKYMQFPSLQYLWQIFLKSLLLIFVSCIPPFIVRSFMEEGLIRFLVVCSISVITTMLVMWLFAINNEVKQMVVAKIRHTFHK